MDKMNVPVVEGKAGENSKWYFLCEKFQSVWLFIFWPFVVHSYYFKEVWKYLKLLIDTLTQSEVFILPAAMIRRNPTRIELTLDDIEEYKNLRGNILFIRHFSNTS